MLWSGPSSQGEGIVGSLAEAQVCLMQADGRHLRPVTMRKAQPGSLWQYHIDPIVFLACANCPQNSYHNVFGYCPISHAGN